MYVSTSVHSNIRYDTLDCRSQDIIASNHNIGLESVYSVLNTYVFFFFYGREEDGSDGDKTNKTEEFPSTFKQLNCWETQRISHPYFK